MIFNYLKDIYKKLYILQNLYIKNKIYKKRKFYSQSKEDIFVLKYFKNKKKGLYVDVGCHHPSRINNTFLLYKHGWRGVNIDMSKLSIDLFDVSRKEDVNIHSAVSTKNKIIDYYTNKNLFLSASIIQKKGSSKFKYKEKVSSKPLTKILDKTIYKDKQIDFLSIDAEGADYEVLKSLDFKKYKPKLITIENNEMIPEEYFQSEIFKLLEQNNYVFVNKVGVTNFFLIKSLKNEISNLIKI